MNSEDAKQLRERIYQNRIRTDKIYKTVHRAVQPLWLAVVLYVIVANDHLTCALATYCQTSHNQVRYNKYQHLVPKLSCHNRVPYKWENQRSKPELS